MRRVGPPVPRSAFRVPRFSVVRRVLIISHAYLSPANRGKLRALASHGVDVTVGVPQRWRDPVLGATLEIAWWRAGIGKTSTPFWRSHAISIVPPSTGSRQRCGTPTVTSTPWEASARSLPRLAGER